MSPGTSGKRAAGRVEMAADVFLFPIANSKTKPAELAEVRDVSMTGAKLVVGESPELRAGGKIALRLVTRDDGAAVLIHCEICRAYPLDKERRQIGVRFLRVLKDCRAAA